MKEKETVLILGANGQLGQCFQEVICQKKAKEIMCNKNEKYQYIFLTHKDVDITNIDEIRNTINKYNNTKYIINCAAYTNVEKANVDREKALSINTNGVLNIGKICKENNIFLITFGTDYLYNTKDNTPIKENHKMEPINTYAVTKFCAYHSLCGLFLNEKYNEHFLFVNTSWLYSEFGNNFVKKIYFALKNNEKRKVVIDQIGSPTYGISLANFIVYLIENNQPPFASEEGILNVCGKGTASWYDLAKEIEIITNKNSSLIEPCLTSDFSSKVERPKYSVLSTNLLDKTYGDDYINHWRIDLKKCIDKLNISY